MLSLGLGICKYILYYKLIFKSRKINKKMIVGLTGTKAGGKGSVADILKAHGYEYSSTSDRVREEAVARGIADYTIRQLQDIGNELREKFGVAVLAKRSLEKLSGKNAIIDGIRNPGEIEELRKTGNFILIGVDAPLQDRFKRLIERARESDPKDWNSFLEMDKRDKGLNEAESGQQVAKCLMMADFKIMNNGSIGELNEKVEQVLEKIKLKASATKQENYKRPSWDEYFLEISRTVAKRGTCDRGRSGCVIVKNKQILVTGYVGAPKGLPHCDEVGHQLETTIHEDRVAREHCVRTTHAEQNAICQAAKLGIPIEGATLYCKMVPCTVCAKMIINSGIRRVVCEKGYQSGAKDLMEQTGIIVDTIDEEIEKYPDNK